MESDAAGTVHQQRVEDLCSATIRAVSGEPDVSFRGRRLHRGATTYPAYAPHLSLLLGRADFRSFRGVADGLALRLRYSDTDLHQRMAPDEPIARLLFEMLEQFRVESISAPPLRGLRDNLRHRHETWLRAFHASGLTETESGILLYTVAQICRSHVTGEPVFKETEDLLEATRFSLAPVIGTDLKALRQHRDNQTVYARHALSIARALDAIVDDPGQNQPSARRVARDSRNAFALCFDTSSDDAPSPSPDSDDTLVLAETAHGYQVFTRDYDKEHRVADLVRTGALREYRQRLDDRIASEAVNVSRLSRELRLRLAEPNSDGWDGGGEEGMIDGGSLTLLVTSPTERRLFKAERIEPAADCLVTFLVDCSGSMRQHNETLALVVDVLARALDLADVRSEVLGFSTGAWNGGRALKDWKRSGRTRHPGRMNERAHLVFKDADTPWRRARPGIAGLLKADLYREGIDGEAVAWACERMRDRPEQRRLLVVVSDGSPMDGATNLVNDASYLDQHLREVVAGIESAGDVRILGLGVGMDLSTYYRNSHAVDLAHATGNEVIRNVAAKISERDRR